MTVITVLLAEDHQTVREGLKLLIGGEPDMIVVAEAGTGTVAVEQAVRLQPAVAIVDISMPEMNGLAAARALRQVSPDTAVIALTRHSDDAYVQELFSAGARGYVLKQSASTELLNAIRTVAAGDRYVDSALMVRSAGQMQGPGRAAARPRISERESEVLRLIAQGHSNKEIAAQLDLSVKTVEVHKANAMRKLNLRGRIDIVRYAVLQAWLAGP